MDFIQGENRKQFQLMGLEAFINQNNTVGFVDAIRTIKNAIFLKSSCSLPIFDFKIKENQKLNQKMVFNRSPIAIGLTFCNYKKLASK